MLATHKKNGDHDAPPIPPQPKRGIQKPLALMRRRVMANAQVFRAPQGVLQVVVPLLLLLLVVTVAGGNLQ